MSPQAFTSLATLTHGDENERATVTITPYGSATELFYDPVGPNPPADCIHFSAV